MIIKATEEKKKKDKEDTESQRMGVEFLSCIEELGKAWLSGPPLLRDFEKWDNMSHRYLRETLPMQRERTCKDQALKRVVWEKVKKPVNLDQNDLRME